MNVRCSERARKCQTIRTPSSVCATPNVSGAPKLPSSADAPGWYCLPFSETLIALMFSPWPSGMSR